MGLGEQDNQEEEEEEESKSQDPFDTWAERGAAEDPSGYSIAMESQGSGERMSKFKSERRDKLASMRNSNKPDFNSGGEGGSDGAGGSIGGPDSELYAIGRRPVSQGGSSYIS